MRAVVDWVWFFLFFIFYFDTTNCTFFSVRLFNNSVFGMPCLWTLLRRRQRNLMMEIILVALYRCQYRVFVRLFPPIHWQKPIFGAMDSTAFFLTQSISFLPLFILSFLYFTLPNIPNIFFFIIFFFGKSSGQIDNFAQQKKICPYPTTNVWLNFAINL